MCSLCHDTQYSDILNDSKMSPPSTPNYELVAAQLLRSVRGRRSQAAVSRLLGYGSNIASRWEAQKAFPYASTFLRLLARLDPKRPSALVRFFPRPPAEVAGVDPSSPTTVAAFLRELRGKTPIGSIARQSGYNRYSISRWLLGSVEPRLPQFLHLIDVMSRRLLDFLACACDPATVPAVAADWKRLQLTRQVAYEHPLSHAVLRALELRRGTKQHQTAWLADRLGLPVDVISASLEVLAKTGQVRKHRGRWQLERVVSVNTSLDRDRALGLKVSWTETALARMRAGAPGNYGYSLFCVSRRDLWRLRDVHLEYVRAMQAIIAASAPGECVGLYCAQLLDLAASDNALAE